MTRHAMSVRRYGIRMQQSVQLRAWPGVNADLPCSAFGVRVAHDHTVWLMRRVGRDGVRQGRGAPGEVQQPIRTIARSRRPRALIASTIAAIYSFSLIPQKSATFWTLSQPRWVPP